MGSLYGHHQIADAAAAEGNLFNQANPASETARFGCGHKVDAVARRQHADAVVDDGFRRVGAWGD